MKPLNLDNSPCSPISSNCVIWQGPDLECIKLCKGDTVSDVVAKLATELCDILDTLNITNYDLSCFNLTSCPPEDFQALINFLIGKICELENITPDTPGQAGGCPDACLVQMADCFGGGTDTLTNYVKNIATRVCNLVDDINVLQLQINSLDTRVTVLENTPAPTFTIPSFTLQCDIGTIIPVLNSGDSYQIDTVLSRFINEEWCPTKAVLGDYTDLSNAVTSQSPCYDGTVVALQYQYTTSAIMQVAYPDYVAVPTTVAEAINNIWISLCDLRNAGKELVTVSAGNNVTVTSSTSVVGTDEVTDYEVNAKDTVVAAGDNITITSVTSPTDVTTYTVNGKEAIVAAGTGISVAAVTAGNDTTYTVTATGVEDTGWQALEGFDYYSGVTPPQCRRIGNVIHFRGTVTVPLDNPASPGNVVTYTLTSYNAVMSPTPFTGAPGGVVLNAAGSVTFNNGSSVIPVSVLPAPTNLDSGYRLFNQIGVRPIDIDATYGTSLSSVATVGITSTKTLYIQVLKDFEITNTRGTGVVGNSPLRLITSNIRSGEYLPDYLNAGTDIHNAPADAVFPLQSDTFNLTWPFSCNAGEEDEIGGFSFILDGLIAYI